MSGTVFNIQRYCSNDGPGIRTNVFLKGCPLNCLWCHNPESKSAKPQIMYNAGKCLGCGKCAEVCTCHSIQNGLHEFDRRNCAGCGKCTKVCPGALELVGKRMEAQEVLDIVEKDKVFYGKDGGLTVTGGEPFAQFEFLMELLMEAKRRAIGVCIETSGYTSEDRIRETVPLTDYYLYDCKETDSELHKKWTGVDNVRISENLKILNDCGAKVILRCPIIPGCNLRDDHFENIAKLANTFECIQRIDIEPYHPLGAVKSVNLGIEYALPDTEFPDSKTAERWIEVIREKTDCPVMRA